MAENESFFWGLIRNIQEKRNKKRMLRNISVQNENNKGIKKYQPSAIEAFFSPSEPLGNVLISGGLTELRNRAVIGALDCALSNGAGVVVLHANNKMLESMLQQRYQNTVVFNRQNAIYEPFIGLSNAEIIRMIQSSTTKLCEIQSGGQYYIEGMTEFIRSKNIPPYCEMYITCPHLDLFDKVDDAESKGYISSALAQRIKTALVQGQAQRSDVENYFNLLRHQAQGLLVNKFNLSKAANLRSIVNRNGIAVLDIGSNTNDLLINLAVCDLMSTANSGRKIVIVIDGLTITSSEKLEQCIKNSGSSIYTVFSSEDVYAAFNADDNLFASAIGKSIKSIIYQHASGLTCAKWSEAIGYYEKQEVTNTYTSGTNYQSMFTVIPGQMNSDTINVNLKREYIVRPEEINKMAKDEVYIIDAINSELANTHVV